MKSDISLPKTGGFFYRCFRICARALYFLLGGTSSGQGNIPTYGQLIFASNHVGRLEPFWIHVCIPRHNISIMAKKEMFKYPITAWFMNAVGAFWIDRANPGPRLLEMCSATFEAQHDLLMFPQGTRCKAFTQDSFKPGIGHLSYKNKVPVVPVYYTKIFSFDKTKRRGLTVRFGVPIYPVDAFGNRKSKDMLEEQIYHAIKALEQVP
jgi:1-acyl-sn-glycerol-3-phosphate acyltransferase